MNTGELSALGGLRQQLPAGAGIHSARMFDLAGVSGDYLAPFDLSASPFSESERPIGAAASSGQEGRIDRKSKLYAQALELESYFVKIMVSAMRNTVPKSGAGGGEESFAAKIYGDMLYEQLSRTVTQNAGFGLADQIYIQLS